MKRVLAAAVLLLQLSLAKAQEDAPVPPAPPSTDTAQVSPPAPPAADGPGPSSTAPSAAPPPAPAAPAAPSSPAPVAPPTVAPPIGYPPQPGTEIQPGSETEVRPNWSTDMPYRHEGLFLRAALGPGYFRLHNDSSADRRTFTAISSSMQFVVGGTARRQVILGGAYFRDQLWRLRVHDEIDDGDEPDLSDYRMALSTFGFFTDVYFGPDSGWHIQALLGRGKLSVRRPSSDDLDEPTGFVFHGGLGREWWFAEAGLVGVVLSCTYARLSVNETFTSTNLRGFVPQLLVTGTYN